MANSRVPVPHSSLNSACIKSPNYKPAKFHIFMANGRVPVPHSSLYSACIRVPTTHLPSFVSSWPIVACWLSRTQTWTTARILAATHMVIHGRRYVSGTTYWFVNTQSDTHTDRQTRTKHYQLISYHCHCCRGDRDILQWWCCEAMMAANCVHLSVVLSTRTAIFPVQLFVSCIFCWLYYCMTGNSHDNCQCGLCSDSFVDVCQCPAESVLNGHWIMSNSVWLPSCTFCKSDCNCHVWHLVLPVQCVTCDTSCCWCSVSRVTPCAASAVCHVWQLVPSVQCHVWQLVQPVQCVMCDSLCYQCSVTACAASAVCRITVETYSCQKWVWYFMSVFLVMMLLQLWLLYMVCRLQWTAM